MGAQHVDAIANHASNNSLIEERIAFLRAAHPDGTEIDPEHWWQALLSATSDGLLDGGRAQRRRRQVNVERVRQFSVPNGAPQLVQQPLRQADIDASDEDVGA